MITKQPLCAAIRKLDTDTRAALSQVLNLGHNQLQGQLTISGMSSLRALMLNDNMLTGLAGAPPSILCPPFMFPRLKTLLNVSCWHHAAFIMLYISLLSVAQNMYHKHQCIGLVLL